MRSLKLDKLKDHEWQLLLSCGNEAFQAFLSGSQSVSRKVWMSLPLETRYHTPAADLYRCLGFRHRSCTPFDTSRRRLQAMSHGHELPEELRPIRPPPQVAKPQAIKVKWADSKHCQLCRAEFWLLMRP